MRRTIVAAVLLAGLGVATLTGCGGDEAASDSGGGGGGGAETLEVGSTDLGDVLTDGEGLTLYLYTRDGGGSSACEGGCLEAWPALEGEPAAGDGVDASLIGTIDRPDATTQATYAGHPLYYYVQDSAPGDVNGQGADEVWWALDADGNPVEGTAPVPSGGGY